MYAFNYLYQNFTSNNLQRYVVTTSGSYAFSNATYWSDQLKQMNEKGISNLSDDVNKANLIFNHYHVHFWYFILLRNTISGSNQA